MSDSGKPKESFEINEVERENKIDMETMEAHIQQLNERATMFDQASQCVDRKYYSFFRERAFKARKMARRAQATISKYE